MTPPTKSSLPPNFWRWVIALVLGFLAGVLTVIEDNHEAWPGLYAVVRGGLVDMIPTLIALKMTLTKTGK